MRLLTTQPPPGCEAIWPSPPVTTTTVPEATGVRQHLDHLMGFYSGVRQAGERDVSVVHDSGLWLPMHVDVAGAAWRSGTPLVISPKGMLMPWARQYKRVKKEISWWLYQRWALASAAMLHATAPSEADAIRSVGLHQPIAVIPNGVTIPEHLPESPPPGKHKTALFLSRVHPKKGLPLLLDAWATVQPANWRLIIAGPDELGHTSELQAMARAVGLQDVVSFSGPVAEQDKWELYAAADLFVLPTHSENFGIVVPEALAAGTPVLTTTGAPWGEVETRDCGWWVSPTVKDITEALADAVSRSTAERAAMGQRGRQLVEENYTWEVLGKEMVAAYRWLVGRGPRPDCVQLP